MPARSRITPGTSARLVSTLLTFLVPAGCASVDEPAFVDAITKSPYRVAFETALTSEHVSQFEKDILVDGIITDAELAEVHARVETCFEDKGYDVAIGAGGYDIGDGGTGDSLDVVLAEFDECAFQFNTTVGGLRSALVNNPENIEWRSLLLTCLQRHEVVDDTFTVEQIEEDLRNPHGITMSDAHDCLGNPQG